MTQEQKKIVEDNISLAHFMAHRYKNVPMEFDDIRSLAYMGLVKAAIHFNPDKQIQFSTFAGRCMMNEILYELRNRKKHSKVTASLDAEIIPGEDITLGEIIPDKRNPYESVLFQMDMKRNEALLDGTELRVLKVKMLDPDISQTDMGKELDISQSYISRVMESMREKMLQA